MASLKAENISDAPGIISVYTSQDIKRWNWQSLEESIPESNPNEESQVLSLNTQWNLSETFNIQNSNININAGVKNAFNDTRYTQSGTTDVNWPMWLGRQFILGVNSSF